MKSELFSYFNADEVDSEKVTFDQEGVTPFLTKAGSLGGSNECLMVLLQLNNICAADRNKYMYCQIIQQAVHDCSTSTREIRGRGSSGCIQVLSTATPSIRKSTFGTT